MTNLRYALIMIGVLSLLLGLSLGQNYYQHNRIEQLEFNRFRQSDNDFHKHSDLHFNWKRFDRAQREAEVQKRLDHAIRRYNKKLERWEQKWRSSEDGLYIVVE